MSAPFFLISLFSTTFIFQLYRFPYLVLENGGGAFLILFFLSLHFFSFPLLVAEKALDIKLKKLDISSLIFIKNFSRMIWLDSILVVVWLLLRVSVILLLLWFFLNLGLNSLYYSFYAAKYYFGLIAPTLDPIIDPKMEFSFFLTLAYCSIVYFIFLKFKKKFFDFSVRYILPIIILLFIVLFFKNILSVNDFTGLKILLYPDFSALNSQSLISLIGHSLGCLLVGIGFYDHSIFKKLKKDPIDIFIQAILQTIVLAFFIGLMALPLIEQVGEMPFGSHFIFEILPRWLSYGQFGQYYSLLYFLSLSYLGLYLSLLFIHLFSKNIALIFPMILRTRVSNIVDIIFVLLSAVMIYLLQKKLINWQGPSFLLKIDYLIFNILLPFLALLTLWFVFRYTNSKERAEVFSKQQVFFHNRIFFSIWQKLSLYLVPILILISWVFAFY